MLHPLLRFFKRRARHRNPLDDVLFVWPDGTPFRVRDLLRSVEIKGITGSGKSSGSGNTLLNAIVAHPRSTLVIIGQKPEDKDNALDLFARHGKLDRLIVIEEGGEHKCDFFDDELKSGRADARALTEFMGVLSEGQGAAQAGGRENDRFWRSLEDRIEYNAIEAVRQGTGNVTAPDLMEFIATAAYGPAQLSNERLVDRHGNEGESPFETWAKGFHYRTMMAAEKRAKTPVESHDYQVFRNFWGREFVNMDDRTRSNGLAGVTGTLHTAVTGLCRQMTSTGSNVSPRMVDDGYSFFINFPISTYGPTGRYINAGWKYKIQKHILRRTWDTAGYFNVLFCDEFQESMTSLDANYLLQARSHGGCLVALTQTIHSEYSQLGGQAGQHKADMLIGNYGLHIYHLSDPKTAQYASDLLGQRREIFVGVTPGTPRATFGGEIFGNNPASFSISQQYQPVLQPRVLMSGLRTGGPANGYVVDGVVIRTGEPFRDGNNYQFVEFYQK